MREFVQFSKSMNFTTAARELHLSQPALSKHVQDMESELRVRLVQRGGPNEGNRLTSAGTLFVEQAGQLLRAYDDMVTECRELDARMPLVRIQGVQHGFTVASQLRRRMEAAGLTSGNFRYVKIDLSLCDALDQDLVDFTVHLEAAPTMKLFAAPDLCDTYDWLPLAPERLCFLVGQDNPLFGAETVDAATIASSEIICGASPSYESWYSAVAAAFLSHGVPVKLKGLPDAPLEGGAFPIGPRRLCACTERFAHYYRDLDAEVTSVLRVREFEPWLYPFLVYRCDNPSPAVAQIVKCFGEG